jgi:4-hydroxy-tetrahydrodipicolinate synthase
MGDSSTAAGQARAGIRAGAILRFCGRCFADSDRHPERAGISRHRASRTEGIRTLHRAHSNFTIVKLEATAIAIASLLDAVDGGLDVFNGRDGIEMLDSMRAGAVGIIPGGEAFDILARAFDHMALGTREGIAEAERLYAKVLPLLILLMESMDTFLVYGKPVLGHRLGIAEINSRVPSTPPDGVRVARGQALCRCAG